MNQQKSETLFVFGLIGLAAAVCATMFIRWEVRREVYVVPDGGPLVCVDHSTAGRQLRSYAPGTELDVRVWRGLWDGEREYGYGEAKR